MRLTGQREKRPLWLAQPKRLMRFALEAVGVKDAHDLLGCTEQGLDLNGRAALPKTDPPTLRVRFRMQIAHENIRSGFRHTCQLSHHGVEILNMSQRE